MPKRHPLDQVCKPPYTLHGIPFFEDLSRFFPLGLETFESFSHPFCFRLYGVMGLDSDVNDFLGKPLGACLVWKESKRWFHGLLTHVDPWDTYGLPRDHDLLKRGVGVCLILEPHMSCFASMEQSTVFRQESPLTILKQLFGKTGIDFESQVKQNGTAIQEQIVQYQESHTSFIYRLLEQYGLFYFYRFEEKKHTFVLSDQKQYGTSVRLNPESSFSWSPKRALGLGSASIHGAAWRTPETPFKSQKKADKKGVSKTELIRHEFKLTHEAEASAQAQHRLNHNLPSVWCGFVTSPEAFPGALCDYQGKPHVVLKANCRFFWHEKPSFYVEIFSKQDVFLPFQGYARPSISGIQIALVEGSPPVDMDPQGRLHIRFLWQDKTSKPMLAPMVHPNAGNGFGLFQAHRVGQYVAVTFLNGDPEQPLILGAIHTHNQPEPYPKDLMCATFRQEIVDQPQKYNEILSDPRKEKATLHMMGYRDVEITAETGDLIHTIKEKDWKTSVLKGSRSTTLAEGNDALTLSQGNQTLSVGGDQTIQVKRAFRHQSKEHSIEAEAHNITVQKTFHVKAETLILEAKTIRLKATTLELNGQTIRLKGGTIDIQANQNLNLKGLNVTVESQTKTKVSGAQTQVQGSAQTQIQGGGLLTLAGGLIKMQ